MTDLAWRDLGGTGDPFLLVHGYTGSMDDFVHVVKPLSKLRRVLVVDLYGHGNSPRLPAYSVEALRFSVVGFIEDVVGEPVDLLGHSMGGWICLPIAIERPDLVRSLVMMDTFGDAPARDRPAAEFAALIAVPDAEAIAGLAEYEAPPSPEPALIESVWGADWVAAHEEFNGQVDPLAIVHLGRELFGSIGSLLGPAAGVECPTTVVVGECDHPFRGPSDRLAAAIPGAELVVIEGAYHSPQLTHPNEWQAAIARHLAPA
jgi:pimeloyl-ACP methyl ester carboxylesterase